MQFDWQAAAIEAATFVCEHLMAAHRGAMPWRHPGFAVLFGNDGYATDDPRSCLEVEAVRERLRGRGIEELGFGLEPDEGYSWAMIVRGDDVRFLFDAVWQSWPDASGIQHRIALDEIAAHGMRPRESLN